MHIIDHNRVVVTVVVALALAGCGTYPRQAAPLVEAGDLAATSTVACSVAPAAAESVGKTSFAGTGAALVTDVLSPQSPTFTSSYTGSPVPVAGSAFAGRADDAPGGPAGAEGGRKSIWRADIHAGSKTPPLSWEDMVVWTKTSVRDEVIIDRIERSGVRFRLTAGEEVRLRQQGVSNDVIDAMEETSRR